MVLTPNINYDFPPKLIRLVEAIALQNPDNPNILGMLKIYDKHFKRINKPTTSQKIFINKKLKLVVKRPFLTTRLPIIKEKCKIRPFLVPSVFIYAGHGKINRNDYYYAYWCVQPLVNTKNKYKAQKQIVNKLKNTYPDDSDYLIGEYDIEPRNCGFYKNKPVIFDF